MSGTSASAPVAAAAFSNINAARMAIGKGSLGWVNPALYVHAASFVNDIVTGNNTCSATAPCCPHGFHATEGWDPATGLGTINYGKMEATFLALGAVVNKATGTPTPSPSTIKPTMEPTERTPKPSRGKPTRRPTADPAARPNRRPTFRPSATNAKTASDDGYEETTATATAPSTVRATLTLAGIAVQETRGADFTKSVVDTVISVLGVPDASVTDITTTSSGRRLLSSVTLSYTVSVAKDMTPEQLIASLQTSVSDGEFLTTFSRKSGLTIDEVTNLQTVDLSVTESAAPAPGTADSSSSTVASVASGCAGGLLLGIMASFLYFNRSKGEKKKFPPIYTSEVLENAGGKKAYNSNKSSNGRDHDLELDTIPKISLPSSPRCSV